MLSYRVQSWFVDFAKSTLFKKPAPSPLPSLHTYNSVSLHVDLTLSSRLFTTAYFSIWLVPLLAVSVDCLYNVEVQQCRESYFFWSGQIASDDLLLVHTHRLTHAHTNNWKISIMIHLFGIKSEKKKAFNSNLGSSTRVSEAFTTTSCHHRCRDTLFNG